MINVKKAKEPDTFCRLVRTPGNRFLQNCPNPTSGEWKKHSEWKKIASELYNVYDGICAYTGEWFSNGLTYPSVDHFLPKSKYPKLAYEWNNYRLTTPRINEHKGDKTNILDPFKVNNGWFVLDIPSCLILPSNTVNQKIKQSIQNTIIGLKLNADDNLVQGRLNILILYAMCNISFEFLKRRYPFIAHELSRQNLSNEDLSKMLSISN